MLYLEKTGFFLYYLQNFLNKGWKFTWCISKTLICWQIRKYKSWNQMLIWVICSIWLERELALWIPAFFKSEGGGVIFWRFASSEGGQVFPCLARVTVAGRMELRYIYFVLVHQNKFSAVVLKKQKTWTAGRSSRWEPEKRAARYETDGELHFVSSGLF